MITRSAIFEGRIRAGYEDRFKDAVVTRLGPLWKKFPGALDVRLLWIEEADADAPAIVMIQQIDYPSHQALADALASPARTEARAATLEVLEMFEGRFYHLVSEGNAVETAEAR